MKHLGTAASTVSAAVSPGSERALTRSRQQAEYETNRAEYLRAAQRLLGSRRKGEANDPDIYIAAIVRVLSAFPLKVVTTVADPLLSPLRHLKWLPEASEVLEACEQLHRSNLARETREAQAAR